MSLPASRKSLSDFRGIPLPFIRRRCGFLDGGPPSHCVPEIRTVVISPKFDHGERGPRAEISELIENFKSMETSLRPSAPRSVGIETVVNFSHELLNVYSKEMSY